MKLVLSELQERSFEIDFVLLCETFLTNDKACLVEIPGYNLLHKSRISMKGGGVAIYIKNGITYTLRDDLAVFQEGKFESIFIEVNSKGTSTIVGEIYRVPNTQEEESIRHFQLLLDKLKHYNNIIIGTDQNFDLLGAHNHSKTAEL